jgi:hypothetical protein
MRKVIAALAVGLALAVPASAQTVDEIIAKNTAAKGGIVKVKSVTSLRVTGRMLVQGLEAPIVLEMQRPNARRMDLTVQDVMLSHGFDGKKAWIINPLQGIKVPQEMSAEEQQTIEEQADIDGPLIDYKAKGHSVELLGKEKVEGSDAYKVKLTMKTGTVRTLYIDATRFLEVKEESKRTIRGREVEGETIYGDYRSVAGMMFPHSIDTGQKGSPQREKVIVEKIEINVPLDAARFKMPAVK